MRRYMLLLLPLAMLACASSTTTVGPGTGLPVVTHHEGVFNDSRVTYVANVDTVDIEDAEGNPGASIVSISYLAEGSDAQRPVVFVFNGGPIVSSVYLHMGSFGPHRIAFADDLDADAATAPLVDNPYSILDVADLVFFDPAGTGFSRPAGDKPLEDYFSVQADAQQTAAFIAAWLEHHDRAGVPVYVVGESYGTNRAAATAGQLMQLDEPIYLNGVVLFGQAVNIIEYAQRPANIISYVASLPTLAALGWYHEKADRRGLDLEAFVDLAWEYARTDYLDALVRGNELPAAQLSAVAERLEQFSGVPAAYFVEQRLRVSKEAYRRKLFEDESLVIGRADGRYVSKAQPDGITPDPSRHLHTRLEQAFIDYLTTELGVPAADDYVISAAISSLDQWGWGGQSPFSRFAYADALTALLEKSPQSRILVAAGYFDTMTTTGASAYLVSQEPWPADRVALKYYLGGHMAYSVEESARAFAADLRELIRTSR